MFMVHLIPQVLQAPEPAVVGDNTRPEQSQASIDEINQKWKKASKSSSESVEEKPTVIKGQNVMYIFAVFDLLLRCGQ